MTEPRASAPPHHGSMAFPLFLAFFAPLVVVVELLYLQNVWLVFATYQVGLCLLVPAIESWRAGRSWREHAEMLGLMRPTGTDRSHPVVTLSIVLGLATAVITGGFLILTRDKFLAAGQLEGAVASWGVTPGQILPTLIFMALINSPAEELFWRGYFPGRLQLARPGSRLPAALTIVLPAVLYASYHAVTIGSLVGKAGGVVVMTSGILVGGMIWGWLRRRTGSVWPSLLSHSGAVVAYLGVYWWVAELR